MSFQSNLQYFYDMFPYAKTASAGTGIPVSVILAQWAHETGFGTSDVSKTAKNHAGIKYVEGGSIAIGNYGSYANYASLDQFVQDYERVMNLSYYSAVRSAGTPEAAIAALGQSPYAEDPNYGQLIQNLWSTYGLVGFDTYQVGGSAAQPSSGGDKEQLAAIGAAAVALFALLMAHKDSTT